MNKNSEKSMSAWKDLVIQEYASAAEYQLRRSLGPLQLALLGIGAIIGAGIFATIGTAATGDAFRPGAGPGLMLSFGITAIVCGFVALCYAEFASMVPILNSSAMQQVLIKERL